MKQIILTKAEILHLKNALESYKYWQQSYPETLTDDAEDELAIALEIITRIKLYEF